MAALHRRADQFEYLECAAANLQVVVPATLAIIFVLLCLTFDRFDEATLLMAILPFALAGGARLMWLLSTTCRWRVTELGSPAGRGQDERGQSGLMSRSPTSLLNKQKPIYRFPTLSILLVKNLPVHMYMGYAPHPGFCVTKLEHVEQKY